VKRCRCCRQSWPIEFYPTARYRVDGTPILRARCLACRWHCGAARRRAAVARTAAYRARLRADVEAVRLARARATWDNTGVGDGDKSNTLRADPRSEAITRGAGVVASFEVMAR
jgi:hypothetical protein